MSKFSVINEVLEGFGFEFIKTINSVCHEFKKDELRIDIEEEKDEVVIYTVDGDNHQNLHSSADYDNLELELSNEIKSLIE
ncbi:hypothetical protein [Vibrio crassostreae]|uniref:hypothetical protein n=1 Tax=Vibrio crassostreae TaxID=246167 RepID=UPI001B3142AD|nr:hypothetical protein [Vibrio crassostreae]